MEIGYLYTYEPSVSEDIKTICICILKIGDRVTFKDLDTNLIWSTRDTYFYKFEGIGPVENFPEYFL